MLFDFLTVKEHLEFYSGLKEVADDEMDALVTLIIHISYVFDLTMSAMEEFSLPLFPNSGSKMKQNLFVHSLANVRNIVLLKFLLYCGN